MEKILNIKTEAEIRAAVEAMTLGQVRSAIRRGDQTLIAELTGYTTDYVDKVLAELRKNEAITKAAREVIIQRKVLFARLKDISAKSLTKLPA